LLAVSKPAGLLCVPDRTGAPSLVELMADWLRAATGRAGHLLSVHRLDRAVSGCVVFARTTKAAQRLGAAFREVGPGGARKLYLARTAPLSLDALELRAAAAAYGGERGPGGVAHVWLAERGKRVVARAGPFDNATHACVRWEARSARLADGGMLLALEPAGGKRHQLRAAAAVGLRAPLLWDALYGAPPIVQAAGDAPIGLHAHALELPHPTARTEAAARELAGRSRADVGEDATCADSGVAEWRSGRLLLRASAPTWWPAGAAPQPGGCEGTWLAP
jgi:23S rRNA pseudouridine1911/1915/1917 synthase